MNSYGIKKQGKAWLLVQYLPPKLADYSAARFARRAKTIARYDSMEAAQTAAETLRAAPRYSGKQKI